jgi:hypothetical protein
LVLNGNKYQRYPQIDNMCLIDRLQNDNFSLDLSQSDRQGVDIQTKIEELEGSNQCKIAR